MTGGERCWVVRLEDDGTPAERSVHTYDVAFELARDHKEDVYLARIDGDEFCEVHEDEPADGCLRCVAAEVDRGDQIDRAIDEARLACHDREATS